MLHVDMDPNLKNKYEEIKKLQSYVQRELPNLRSFKETKKRELKEQMNNNVPLYEIYETIKSINMNIRYHNGQVNKIIDKLKFARLGRTVFKDISLNLSNGPNTSFGSQKTLLECDTENRSFAEKARIEDTSFDLVTQMSQINITTRADASMNINMSANLNEEGTLKHTNETRARFYSQLFDVLRRRQKIPSQVVDLNRLELLESKFDEAISTQVNNSLLPHFLNSLNSQFQVLGFLLFVSLMFDSRNLFVISSFKVAGEFFKSCVYSFILNFSR